MRLLFRLLLLFILLNLSHCIGIDVLPDPETGLGLSRVEITGLDDFEIFEGQNIRLSASYYDKNGILTNAQINWQSTNNAVAIIDGEGNLNTLKTGQTQIIASVVGSPVRDTITLSVVKNEQEVSEINISANKTSFLVGETLDLSSMVANQKGMELNDITLDWNSSQPNVISLTEKGKISAIAIGQSEVYAFYKGIRSNKILLSVVSDENQIAEIIISAPSNKINAGETIQLTAKAYNKNGEELNGITFEWESDTPQIISVNSSGLATGLADGFGKIRAKSNGFKSTAFEIEVIDLNKVREATISSPTNTIKVGQTLQFSLQAKNAEGNTVNPSQIVWTSSNTSLLTINSAGLATAKGVGTVTVSAVADGVQSNEILVAISAAEVQSRSGNFQGTNGYSVSGTTILKKIQGSENLILEFSSNFNSSNGPGLHVYLSNSATSTGGALDLGSLKQTSGSHTYDVPTNVKLGDYNYVLVYCKPFAVLFGRATLE